MKTIFISSFHPLISRNILQTKVLKYLSADFRVVILCPGYKFDYFNKKFQSDLVIIESVVPVKQSFFYKIWKEFGNSLLRTTTISGNRRERFNKDKKIIGYVLFLIIQFTIANKRLFIILYQKISRYILSDNRFDLLFEKYNPDGVFITDIFNDEDIKLSASSIRSNIPVIGMVRSWDNATNKGILTIIPDKIIAHNEIICDELRRLHFVSDSIVIDKTGIPQFDYYMDYVPSNKSGFYKDFGLDTEKKIILFAPTGQKFVEDDWFILNSIIEGIKNNKIKYSPQVIVRFPPGDVMDMSKVKLIEGVVVRVDRPGVDFNSGIVKDRELSDEDMVRLADTLFYSDILISVGSTLCIDISVFDKPVICPNILVPEIDKYHSMTKMYNKYHYNYLLRTNACLVPKSVDSFLNDINKLLDNPQFNSKERKQLINEQVWKFDGQACFRISQSVSNFLK